MAPEALSEAPRASEVVRGLRTWPGRDNALPVLAGLGLI